MFYTVIYRIGFKNLKYVKNNFGHIGIRKTCSLNFEIEGPVVYGRPVCSTHCAQKKLMHTIASWIRNQCHFSSSTLALLNALSLWEPAFLLTNPLTIIVWRKNSNLHFLFLPLMVSLYISSYWGLHRKSHIFDFNKNQRCAIYNIIYSLL